MKIWFRTGPIALAALILLLGPLGAAAKVPAGYTVTLVAVPDQPNGYSEPLGINAVGAVVARWFGASQADGTAIYQRRTTGQVISQDGESDTPNAINKGGTIAGSVMTSGSGGSTTTTATVWKKKKPSALPALVKDTSAQAWGINDGGLIVGAAETKAVPAGDVAPWTAVSWQDGAITDLGTLPNGGDSVAFDVNASGQIVGAALTTPNPPLASLLPSFKSQALETGVHAVEWIDGAITDLGTLPGSDGSIATAINDQGQIVGIALVGGQHHAVEWTDGKITDLGTLPGGNASEALDINASGQVVGDAENPNPTSQDKDGTVAVLWDDGKPVVLQTLMPEDEGWYAQGATCINDNGQIGLFGVLAPAEGDFHYYGALITPVDQ